MEGRPSPRRHRRNRDGRLSTDCDPWRTPPWASSRTDQTSLTDARRQSGTRLDASLPEPCSEASALRQSGSSTLTTRGPVPTKERRISWGSSLGLTSRWTNPAGTWKNPPVSTCAASRPPGPNSKRARPRITWPSTSRSPWWCQPDATPPSARARTRIARGVSKAISRTSPGVEAAGTSPSALTARIPRCLPCEAML
jgi:hypothetical protein